MAELPADDFVRENRPLSAWIDDLIGPDRGRREQAALMIQAMQVGVRDPHVDITAEMLPMDSAAHQAAFKRAVQKVFSVPGASGHAKIDRLMEMIEEGRKRSAETMRADGDLVTTALAQAKLTEQEFSSVADEIAKQMEQSYEQASVWAEVIFGCLAEPLRGHTARLESWLQQRGLEVTAREAIQRMGPAAKRVAPGLFSQLDALGKGQEAWWWNGIPALTSAIGDDAAGIRQLMDRLTQSPAVAGNAAAILGGLGPAVRGEIPDIVDRLLALSRHPTEFVRLATFGALARHGTGRADVAARLVEAIQRGKNYEPGYAIDVLAPKVLAASQAVPLLMAQFEIFEEFDPDRTYQGEHARLAEALMRYGAEAAPALPVIERYLSGDEGINESVVNCLAAIGPVAVAAAPALKAAAQAAGINDPAVDPSFVGNAWRVIAAGKAS